MDTLIIEGCNFTDFPVGGQLSFARQLMKVYPGRIGLVGITTDKTNTGQWLNVDIEGVSFPFFAVGRRRPSSKKPIVPGRLHFFLQLKKYHRQIISSGCRNVFVQSPETLLAAKNWGWKSLCYRFAGVENPIEDSRYRWGKLLASFFEYQLFNAMDKAEVILACADTEAISKLKERGGSLVKDLVVHKFPTRVDTQQFFPSSKSKSRKHLGIPQHIPVIVNCGRLNRVKGWDLILKAFAEFVKDSHEARLYFVGDGESRKDIENLVSSLGLKDKAKITGFVETDAVAAYLNSCDLCVIGSYKEGWSLAMLEALACGKPLVSTTVSGAKDLIVEGVNGFVIKSRDPKPFAKKMLAALELSDAQAVSLSIAQRYALKNLASELGRLWPPLKA